MDATHVTAQGTATIAGKASLPTSVTGLQSPKELLRMRIAIVVHAAAMSALKSFDPGRLFCHMVADTNAVTVAAAVRSNARGLRSSPMIAR